MAAGFNLTAQLNLKGPTNVSVIVADIKKQLGNINASVNLTVAPAAAKNISQLNASLQTFNQTLTVTTTNATATANALRNLGTAIGSINAASLPQTLNNAASATNKLAQASSNTARQLAASTTEMTEFGKQSGLAIRRFAAFSTVTGVVYGLSNAINNGIRAYIDYDKELVKLQQVTGQSAAGLKGLENTITTLATSLGVGSAELTNISSTLAQAGLSARDTEKALKALALSSLAPSFDSMNETVEGSIALMRQFGINAGDLEKALGSVNSVAAKFAVEAADLITAIQRTGGVFATASKGVSEGTDALNEFLAVFTSIRATTRESAETIATGLRTIFTRIQRGDTIQALKEYGVNLQDLDGKFVGAYKAVELLSKGLGGLDPRDLRFSKIIEELGGFRQIGKVIPLIQQFATAQDALKVAQTGQGSLAADAVKAQEALAVQISKVREEFLALFREIGQSDSFQAIAKGALSVTSALIKAADSIKGILPVLGVMLAFKGASAAVQFGSGFLSGVRGSGGAKGLGNRMGGGSGGMNSGGEVRRFAAGGLVPGSGNSDSVSARLTPGEFVIRKSAVSSIGAGNLSNMNQGGLAAIDKSQGKRINKYAGGNIVTQIGGVPATTKVVKGKDNINVGFENDYYNINADKKIIKIAYNKKDKKFRADKKLIDISDVDNLIYNNPKSFETWENIAAKVLGATKLNEQDPNYPIDLIKGKKLYDAKFRPESGFKEKDAALKALSHRLEETNSGFRYNQSKKTIKLPKFLGKSTRPERDDFQDPGSITYIYPEFKDIPANLKSIEEGMRIRRSQAENLPDEGAGYFARKAVSAIGDSKYISGNKDIINLISMPKKNKSSGGIIQKFGIGGEAKAIRRIGIIDSDVLRQTANAEKVADGMKLIGADSIKDYTIQLAKLGVQKRKSGDLKKFRVIAGAAGSGKSSLATGVSANDSATLRQTVRSQIISPQDLDNVDEVLTITANVSDAKLEAYLRDADRTYTLSSDTKAEQNLVKDNKDSRDVTGKLLYDREPGRTKGVSPDFGIEQATLMDELGSKNVVLGRKEDAQGNLTNRFRRKRGDELPEIVQAEGFITGGFAPPTRGHRGAFDTLLENVIAKNPNATIKDILVSVAPNVAMVEGKEGLAHAARYGIFDADFRSLLAGINFKGAMISSDTQPTGGILPKVMEVPGENNRRKFARLKGAMAVTSGKEKGALGKYDRAGIEVTDIPRIEDISATTVRELLFSQNYTELDKIINPEVGAILKGNQPQLKNRSVMVPVLLEEINKIAEINKILANQKADDILANAPGGPYTNITKKLKAEHPEIAAQVKSIRDERDAFKKSASGAKSHSIIRQLASTYPEIYGIDPSRRTATTATTISAKDARSHLGDRVKSLLPGGTEIPEPSLLESIKQNVIKQLAAPKGAGTLPTDSKTINRTFLNTRIPSDPTFGMFSGKTIDPGIVKQVWRQTYPGLPEDKEPSYTAVKEWLESQYKARTGAKTEELSQAIQESKMVGLVGMLPIGHERLSGPFTWMLGKNAAGDDVSVTASIIERGLGKKYEEEVKAAQLHAERGSESLASGLSSKMKKQPKSLRSLNKNQLETLGQGNIEGAYIEQALARLWANLDNVSTRTRPIDYPDGLGESAELFPGISPNMPTEVKRTINSDSRSDALKEFQRYFRLINGVPEPKEAKTQKEVVKALAEGGEVQKFVKGGDTRSKAKTTKTTESILLSVLKQRQSTDPDNTYFKSSNNTINNILGVSGVDKILAQIQQFYGVSSAKFLGSGGENAAFDIGNKVLKISRTGLGIQTLAKDFGVKKKELDKMGNYQLPTGVDGVAGYRKVKSFGKLTAAIQDKVVTRDTDKAMKDAEILQGKLAAKGQYWLDAGAPNMGYDKKGRPTVIDGLIFDKSFVDKMKPDYREDIEVEGMMAEAAYEKSLKKGKLQKKSFGGIIQKLMAGGAATKKPKEVFGTGETIFPSKISKTYAEEEHSASESLRAKLAWDKNPKDERIMVDDDKVKTASQQPFDKARFTASFKEKISRDTLFDRMSDFAKFIGLPQEDLTTALPLQLDFGASKRGGGLGMFAAAQFEKGATGIRPYEGYDLSKSGYGEKQKQEAYGLKKLITTQEKRIAKIVKTPTRTFDDGSFSFDREAYSKANIELDSLKNKSFTLTRLKSDAEKAGLSEQNATASATGRGTISFASSMGYSSDTKNSTLYHEMTHQLFQGLRTKSAGSFDKYRDRVSSLFSGDNDDLADAFDSLTAGGGYSSADVVYGRSYKSNNLSQILSSYYRQNLDFSRDTATIPQDTTKNLASLSNQSTAAKRAREYRPINPKVNQALLQAGDKFGMTQEKIDRMEDNGKEEFLTTLIEKAPQLDQNLQGILDSTLSELLGGAGIKRQKYAAGGKVDYYSLEKNSGFNSREFDLLVNFAKTNGLSLEDFKKYLAQRSAYKQQNSGLKMNPASVLRAITPEAPRTTDKQRALANKLRGPADPQYRPILTEAQRIASDREDVQKATRGFAVGGSVGGGSAPVEVAASKKPEKQFGKISITEDGNMVSAGYLKNNVRSGYATAYKMRNNLYYVGLSSATKGYGPKLYDALMETVTEKGAMLTSDRSMVSGDARKVWEYYFKNRGEVKKTPLEPKDWTRNEALLDPKLHGRAETWPPATDPAWILQSGYSKSPSLINTPDVVRPSTKPDTRAMAASFFAAKTKGFSDGGTIPALVSNGEAYIPPETAKEIGYPTLHKMNMADRNGMDKFARGGISVFRGPGSGTSDSIGPIGLPVGSFILREKATKALGLASGGSVQRFATGGGLPVRPDSIQSSTISINDNAVNALKNLQKVIEQLGVTSTRISSLLINASTVSYKAAEKVAQAELDRVKSAGGSINQIIDSENALATIRDAGNKDVSKRNTLEGVFGGSPGKSSGGVQQEILLKANQEAATRTELAQNKKNNNQKKEQKKQEADALLVKREGVTNQTRENLTAEARKKGPMSLADIAKIEDASLRAGRSIQLSSKEKAEISSRTVGQSALTQDEKSSIYRASTINATSSVTGVSKDTLKSQNISGDDIRTYAQQSMMDRKTLTQMDKELIRIKRAEYAAAGKSASEAEVLIQQELANRRKIATATAQAQGLSGPGRAGYTGSGWTGNLTGSVGAAFGGLGNRAAASVRQTASGIYNGGIGGNFMAAGRGIRNIGAGLVGQNGFYASMGLGMIAGQGENIAGAMTSDKRSKARLGAGIEAGVGTAAAGLGLASSVAMIPGVGPFAAAAILATTAITSWTEGVKAAEKGARDFEKGLRTKDIEDSGEKLSKDIETLQKNPSDENARNKVILAAKNQSVKIGKDNEQELKNAQAKKAGDNQQGYLSYIMSLGAKVATPTLDGSEMKDLAKQRAKASEQPAQAARMAIESQMDSGKKFSEIVEDPGFKELAGIIAEASPAFQAAKMNIEEMSDGAVAFTGKTRDQLIAQKRQVEITKLESDAGFLAQSKTKEAARAMDEANKAGRRLSMTFDSMAKSFEQALGRLSYELDSMANSTDSAIDALNGQAKIGKVKSKDVNVLQNPDAYDEKTKQETSKRMADFIVRPNEAGLDPLEQKRRQQEANKVEKLLNSDTDKVGRNAVGAVAGVVTKNASAPIDVAAAEAKTQLESDIKDLPEQVQSQILSKFEAIKKEVDATTGLEPKQKTNLFAQKLQDELGNAASEAAGKVKKMGIEAASFKADSMNRFIDSVNRAASAQTKATELLNKAKDTRTESDVALREATSGGKIGLGERQKIVNNRIGRLTGGEIDPTKISKNIEKQTAQRSALQNVINDGSRDDKDRMKAAESLKNLDVEINKNQQALEELANSTDMAAAAMDQLQNVQKMQADRLANIDQILTSTPQELKKFNESLIRVQQRAMGINPGPSRDAQKAYNMTLRQTGGNRRLAMEAGQAQMAQDRGTDLRTMEQYKSTYKLSLQNQVNPQTGKKYSEEESEKKFQTEAANARGQMAFESGAIRIPGLAQGIMSAVDPNIDPARKEAEQTYKNSVAGQAAAQEELSRLKLVEANLSLLDATNLLGKAFKDLPNYFNNIQNNKAKDLEDVRIKVAEKPIGASTGRYINFKPQGTDTIPAMLTPGEFVINARSTAQHLPLLTAINNGTNLVGNTTKMSKGGVVYLAGGGKADKDKEVSVDKFMQEMDRQEIVASQRYDIPESNLDRINIENRRLREQDMVASEKAGQAESSKKPTTPSSADQQADQAPDSNRTVQKPMQWGGFGFRSKPMPASPPPDSSFKPTVSSSGGAPDSAPSIDPIRSAMLRGRFAAAIVAATNPVVATPTKPAVDTTTQMSPPRKSDKKSEPEDFASVVLGKNANAPQTIFVGSGTLPYQTAFPSLGRNDNSNFPKPIPRKFSKKEESTDFASAVLGKGANGSPTLFGASPMPAATFMPVGRNNNKQYSSSNFPKPRNMAEVQMYKEGLSRGMTIQQIKNERQQAYRSRSFSGRNNSQLNDSIASPIFGNQSSRGKAPKKPSSAPQGSQAISGLNDFKPLLLGVSEPKSTPIAITETAGAKYDRERQEELKEKGYSSKPKRKSIIVPPNSPLLRSPEAKAKQTEKPEPTSRMSDDEVQQIIQRSNSAAYPKISDEQVKENTELARTQKQKREQTQRNDLISAGVDVESDNTDRLRKSGMSTKNIIEFSIGPKIQTEISSLEVQISKLQSQQKKGFLGLGKVDKSAEIKELTIKLLSEQSKLESVRTGPVALSPKEKIAEAKNRAEIETVKANSKDTRTFSEKYLGFSSEGYKAESAAGLVASAEIGIHSALDAMGRPTNDKSRPDANRVAVNRRLAKDKDNRPFSEKYLGLNFGAGVQTVKEQVAALGSAGSVLNQSIEQRLGIKPTDRLGRPLSKKAIAARKKEAETFNKGMENAPGLKTMAKVGMGALEVVGAAGESGVGVIRTGVGTTVAIGAGLTAGVAESVGANTVARYADAFSEQGAIEAERGVRNVQNAGATIGQNLIDSSLGTNIYGDARKESTSRIADIAQKRNDAAGAYGGNAGRYLQTGADLTTEVAGSAATDIGFGKLAKVAQKPLTATARRLSKAARNAPSVALESADKLATATRSGASVALENAGKLGTAARSGAYKTATAAMETVTNTADKARKYAGKAKTFYKQKEAAYGERLADKVRKIRAPEEAERVKAFIKKGYSPEDAAKSAKGMKLLTIPGGPAQRKVDKLIARGYSPEYAADRVLEGRFNALSRIQDRSLERGASYITGKLGRGFEIAGDSIIKGSVNAGGYLGHRALDGVELTGRGTYNSLELLTAPVRGAKSLFKKTTGGIKSAYNRVIGKKKPYNPYLTPKPQGASATKPPASTIANQSEKEFIFEAIDATTGKEIRDIVNAATEAEAQATIRSMGYMVTRIKDKNARSLLGKLFGRPYAKGGLVYASSGSLVPQSSPPGKDVQDIRGIELGEYQVAKINNRYTETKDQTVPALDKILDKQSISKASESISNTVNNISNVIKGINQQTELVGSIGTSGNKELFAQMSPKTISSSVNNSGPQYKADGGIVYASNGTFVAARSIGTDTVPAMLTPGEFVVNRQATQQHMPILQAINSGAYNQGGVVKYLAEGGIIAPTVMAPKYLSSGGGVTPQYLAAGGSVGSLDAKDFDRVVESLGEKVDKMQGVVNQMGTHIEDMGNKQVSMDFRGILQHTGLGNIKTDILNQANENAALISQQVTSTSWHRANTNSESQLLGGNPDVPMGHAGGGGIA